jgi:hypothetical protein
MFRGASAPNGLEVVPMRTNDFLNLGFKEIKEAVSFFAPKKGPLLGFPKAVDVPLVYSTTPGPGQ